MRFRVTLNRIVGDTIPVNYNYPLSSAIYRILSKGNAEYAEFLHEKGYQGGFKLFSFSQISCPFRLSGDRMLLNDSFLSFDISFHMPDASVGFMKGLFQSEQIDIADKRSKCSFKVHSIDLLRNSFDSQSPNDEMNRMFTPQSPVVVGFLNERNMYDFLAPDDPRFVEGLLYNWKSKIDTVFSKEEAENAVLALSVLSVDKPFKSRLIAIRSGTPEETKIRGWLNFRLNITGEYRFVELLLNAGAGLYNAQGCGYLRDKDR